MNKKPLFILLFSLLFFAVFIYFISRPSEEDIAIEKIKNCDNIDTIKSIFNQYKVSLFDSDDSGNKTISLDFQNAIRDRLSELNLSEEESNKCLQWLPPLPINYNVVVVPDLSRRITDTLNNPHQVENDTILLNYIWNSFVTLTKLKQDSKDKLLIDVTGIEQAKGQFDIVADSLQFDLSKHNGKSNRLFFTTEKNECFSNCIKKMYQSALQKPLGADYRDYFNKYLSNRLKKSSLKESFVNKVIIITDGYLEPESKAVYTKIYGYQNQLYSAIGKEKIQKVIDALKLNIPTVDVDLKETQFLICEVNERKGVGQGKDFEILKTYWEDWLNRMGANNVAFIQREQSMNITKGKIDEFFKSNLKKRNEEKPLEIDTKESSSNDMDNSMSINKKKIELTPKEPKKDIVNGKYEKQPNFQNSQKAEDHYTQVINDLINSFSISKLNEIKQNSTPTCWVKLDGTNTLKLNDFLDRLKKGNFKHKKVYDLGIHPNSYQITVIELH